MKMTKKIYVQLCKYDWEKEPQISVSTCKFESDKNQIVMPIQEVDIEFDIPKDAYKVFDKVQIVELEKQKKLVFAKAQSDITRIEEQIQSLLCIENNQENPPE